MSGALTHSPADILQALLVALGLGSQPPGPTDPAVTWPVFVASEPAAPDEAITTYDTEGRDFGFTMTDGERQEHHGVQVRVRASTHAVGWKKARAIAVALDESVYQETVVIEGVSYFVHDVIRTSNVIPLGKEEPTSKRTLFTINAVVTLHQS